jgi:hypothetical protein
MQPAARVFHVNDGAMAVCSTLIMEASIAAVGSARMRSTPAQRKTGASLVRAPASYFLDTHRPVKW